MTLTTVALFIFNTDPFCQVGYEVCGSLVTRPDQTRAGEYFGLLTAVTESYRPIDRHEEYFGLNIGKYMKRKKLQEI